ASMLPSGEIANSLVPPTDSRRDASAPRSTLRYCDKGAGAARQGFQIRIVVMRAAASVAAIAHGSARWNRVVPPGWIVSHLLLQVRAPPRSRGVRQPCPTDAASGLSRECDAGGGGSLSASGPAEPSSPVVL